eukprot:SAG11_NODE_13997_length_629_cov_1.198113_1_plen_42_part_10
MRAQVEGRSAAAYRCVNRSHTWFVGEILGVKFLCATRPPSTQ